MVFSFREYEPVSLHFGQQIGSSYLETGELTIFVIYRFFGHTNTNFIVATVFMVNFRKIKTLKVSKFQLLLDAKITHSLQPGRIKNAHIMT